MKTLDVPLRAMAVAWVLAGVAHFVVTIRAVWKLWEWPGIALWLGALVVGAVACVVAWPQVFLIEAIFFLYVYTRLGRQTGQAVATTREVFEE